MCYVFVDYVVQINIAADTHVRYMFVSFYLYEENYWYIFYTFSLVTY